MKVNVNKIVRVALTKCGAEWINCINQKEVDDWMEVIPRLNISLDDIKRIILPIMRMEWKLNGHCGN